MSDGHLNKCKVCTKDDTKKRLEELVNDKEWYESEKKRHREKYYRLDYKEKHKPTSEEKKETMTRYIEKYPEKHKAKIAIGRSYKQQGYHQHHWSYNDEHLVDVISLEIKDHYFLHRHIIYDQERMMYRRIDTMVLLDTKEEHLKYFQEIKEKNV